MKAKWYICTLFLIFISLGAFQEQVSTPNQEIILEFVDTQINQKNIETTIAQVKQKLLKVGVANIKIDKTQNGSLKISYYSIVDIDNIKKELAKKHNLVLNKNSHHKEGDKDASDYNISIHKITNQTDVSNSDYKFVFENKNQSDRFTTYNFNALLKKTEQYKAKQHFKTSYRINKSNTFIKDRTLNKAIEARAGPKRIFS